MQNVGQSEKIYYRGSNIKKENSEFESFVLKIILNFDDIIKYEDFDFYNTLSAQNVDCFKTIRYWV